MPAYFAYMGVYLTYILVALGLFGAGLAVYVWVTPYKEFRLIREGNMAASCSLVGTMIGFALPLASAMSHSVDLADMAIWSVIALVFQILAFAAATFLFKGFKAGIEEGKVSYGIMLGGLSVAVGILNAGALTY
ncbi:MAG: DUF350 domain-containing protein [Magnetospirillum sp. WYHS-4]